MEKLFLERLKTLKILYAEDEEGIRENVAASLRYYVKEVIEAENGKMALELYETKHPDIVITDILMPLMNGIDLVKQIRKKDQTTPIVIISAHTDKEYLLNVVNLHLEHYVIKPVTFNDIMMVLSQCLKRNCV